MLTTITCSRCQNVIEITELLNADLRLIADSQAQRIAELEAALLRIGNINADGECYENPDNPQGCVRCRIALEIINTQYAKTGGGE